MPCSKVGSHVQLKYPNKPGRVTVPNDQGFDLPKQIVRSIIRQAGLPNDEFADLLDKRSGTASSRFGGRKSRI